MASSQPSAHSRVVGSLACQRDSSLQSLDTQVVSCTNAALKETSRRGGIAKSKTKKPVNGAAERPETADSSKPEWLIEFADSVLFPEGGGQPSDHGTISPSSGSSFDPFRVTFIERRGLHCICHSPQLLASGTLVRQDVDWSRRWDHMQQHTGQHLLSAIMDKTYGDDLKTLGWGMGSGSDLNYVDVPRKPSEEEIQSVQERCNEIIRENLTITVESPDDAKVDKLPKDYDQAGGVVRAIKIGDLDTNTCCGTHLSQTADISLILISHTQSVNATRTRLYFVAGDRATRHATSSMHTVRSIARLVSSGTGPGEVLANVNKLKETATESKRNENKLLRDIAKYEADSVKQILRARGQAFVHDAGRGVDFINMIVFEVRDVFADSNLVVLASGETGKGGHIVIVGDMLAVESLVVKVKEIVAGIKGGGKGERWQGKVLEWKKGELEALKKLVET